MHRRAAEVMDGFGPPPPPEPLRHSAAAVVLRLLFATVPVVTLGILAWVPMLRLAVVRRRTLDWIVFCAVAITSTGAFMLAGYTEDENNWQTNVGVSLLLLLAAGTTGYFLYADPRGRRGKPAPPTAYQQQHQQHQPTEPYPWPGPPGPQPSSGQPPTPPPPVQPPSSGQPPTPPPPVQPPPSAPTQGRIDQVRAELEELSAYLREQEQS